MAKRPLTLLSYNIHKGFNLGARRFVLPEMRDAVRSVGADLLFLQEVQGEHNGHSERVPEWPAIAQFEFLAEELWPHAVYGKNVVHSLGHHGNAILSKYPIVAWKNIDVSAHRFERRGLLHAVIELPNTESHLHALCVHLGLSAGGRRAQVKDICDLVDSEVPAECPLIVAGDFNDWSLKVSAQLSKRLGLVEVFHCVHGMHARTFPSLFPMLQLDRVYCRGFEVARAEVVRDSAWRKLSDHVGLFAALNFTEYELDETVD